MTVAPAVVAVGPLLMVERSALARLGTVPIVVLTLELGFVPSLLPGVGSGVAEVLLAVLLTALMLAGAIKPIVRFTVMPLAIVTGVKVTIPVVELYVPPSDAVTPVNPGMMLSVIVTLLAELGPLLTVAIV